MSDRPLIAVVVPAYNLATFLSEALESVVTQSLPPEALDILVIDDGSTDDTPEVAARFAPRVRCIRQENRGLPAARNRGAAETTAPYLTFLDADDRLRPSKLAAELAILEADAATDVAYSGWDYIDDRGARLPQRGWSRDEGDVLARLLRGNIMHPHAATLRRSTFDAADGFDESLTSVEDWDLWLRVSLNGARWRAVGEAALEYRIRGDGMHANPGRMLANRLRVLDKTFARIAVTHPNLLSAGPAAYRNAHIEAACDWARARDFTKANDAIRAAARQTDDFLFSTRGLREVCRLLVPLGYRNDAEVIARWAEIGPVLRALVRAATADRDIVARARAEATRLRVAMRYARKRLGAPNGSSR